MEFEISLNDLKFYSYHGVFEEERKIGNEFLVNLSVTLPFSSIVNEDKLEGTVSYAALYEIVADEMKIPRNLLELVAVKIGERIKAMFPQIINGWVKIEKVRPPIREMLGSAAVKLKF